jgi:hypothetical protein
MALKEAVTGARIDSRLRLSGKNDDRLCET